MVCLIEVTEVAAWLFGRIEVTEVACYLLGLLFGRTEKQMDM